ncbi:hypothetical protein F5Y17DRAFT_439955 [Xylariaceae sp. FL0594]|nr:hypothetical protein F5Y17DRAFT_439955 [Xylariaceae sp. FL0594]
MLIFAKWSTLAALQSIGMKVSASSSGGGLTPITNIKPSFTATGTIGSGGSPVSRITLLAAVESLKTIEPRIQDGTFLSIPSLSPSLSVPSPSSPTSTTLVPDSPSLISAPSSPITTTTTTATAGISARQTPQTTNTDIHCEAPILTKYASVFHIQQGISYLRHIQGDCTIGPGPGNCSRVSCSYDSGIWFCNDNPGEISVPCSAFGDKAEDIIIKCYSNAHNPHDDVYGQNFDKAGWNVIVQGDTC